MVLKKAKISNVMHVVGLLTKEEAELPSYEHGVSCVFCIDKTTEKQKEGFRMRQSQIAAAKRKRL